MKEQIFKGGDKVYDYSYGWGKVSKQEDKDFPLFVRFDNGLSESYTKDGRFFKENKPTLSFTEYTLEGFSQERVVAFEKYEPVLVRGFEDSEWRLRYHSGNGNRCYLDGYTSKANADTIEWEQIKKLKDFINE